MIHLLAQADPRLNSWNGLNGSTELWTRIIIAFVVGIALIFLLMAAPTRARRPIVAFVTFLAGLFYVVFWLWPKSVDRDPREIPVGTKDTVSFWLEDALPIVAGFTNILTAFLLGLGIYSLLRVHGRRLVKMQKDWFFSAVLLTSLFGMAYIGLADWASRRGPEGAALENPDNWQTINYARDFLFDGLLQQMDAAMFSLIAFFILSAAYRAFRIKSIEATILLATALVFILSLMGPVEKMFADTLGSDPNSFQANFTLTSMKNWLQSSFQNPSIRAIDFGIGIGALAMGLRLWLSLEKGGSSA